MGPQIPWVQSYVTDDKMYCVYITPNEEMVREHARQGGFLVNRNSEIRPVIDPTAGKGEHSWSLSRRPARAFAYSRSTATWQVLIDIGVWRPLQRRLTKSGSTD